MSLDPFMRHLEGLLEDLPHGRREDVLAVTRQLRRYAALMEQTVAMSQAVFEGASADRIAHLILEGTSRIGQYHGGAIIMTTVDGPTIAAAHGVFVGTEGRQAPLELIATRVTRLSAESVRLVSARLGIDLPAFELYLVPIATTGSHVGTLALLDTNGESPDDRLMEAYASRAVMAYLHAARRP